MFKKYKKYTSNLNGRIRRYLNQFNGNKAFKIFGLSSQLSEIMKARRITKS